MTSHEIGQTVYIDQSKYGRVSVRTGKVVKVQKNGWVRVEIRYEASGNRATMAFTDRGQEVTSDKWNKARLVDKDVYDRLKAKADKDARFVAAREQLKVVDFALAPSRVDDKAKAVAEIDKLLQMVKDL